MRAVRTSGISFIEPVPGGTSEWYYGISREQGDLYEAEALFHDGGTFAGNTLCLVRYPGGEVFFPVPGTPDTYTETPVYLDGCIYTLQADFGQKALRIFCFDGSSHTCTILQELPLDIVRNCYNLQLHTAPLSLTRQGDDGLFEIVWPDRACFAMDPHESFFLREGSRLYFSKWYEEGEGVHYRYWEETIVRDPEVHLIETLPGDIRVMPNGELWHLY